MGIDVEDKDELFLGLRALQVTGDLTGEELRAGKTVESLTAFLARVGVRRVKKDIEASV